MISGLSPTTHITPTPLTRASFAPHFGGDRVTFGQRPGTRKDVPVDDVQVENYLAMLKAFPKTSEPKFIEIFETQMTDHKKHMKLARKHGITDVSIFKLNAIIIGLLGKRYILGQKEASETSFSSLGKAQLLYLEHLGRPDLVEAYKTWKYGDENTASKT